MPLERVWPIQEEKFEQDFDEDRLEFLYRKLGEECGEQRRFNEQQISIVTT